MFGRLRADIQAVFRNDPAVKSWLEVFLCYPGVHALCCHRVAHWFYQHKLLMIARCFSQFCRFCTGIEIHPGAKIGSGLFMDHGMGIVIGETAEIGDNVIIFHGATLGGTGKDTGKRHPTIGSGAFISTGAKVLGPVVVGQKAKIGAGAVVLHDVPANSTVVGIPARVVRQNGIKVNSSAQIPDKNTISDITQKLFGELLQRVEALEKRINQLEEETKLRKILNKQGDMNEYQSF